MNQNAVDEATMGDIENDIMTSMARSVSDMTNAAIVLDGWPLQPRYIYAGGDVLEGAREQLATAVYWATGAAARDAFQSARKRQWARKKEEK